jgi:hypothetical protein
MVQNRSLPNLEFFYFENRRFSFETTDFEPPFIFVPVISEIRKSDSWEVLAENDFVLVFVFGADFS